MEAACHKLRQLNRDPLKQGEHKNEGAYKKESQPYRKRASLMKKGPRSPSLAIFLEELTLKTTPLPEPPGPPGPGTGGRRSDG